MASTTHVISIEERRSIALRKRANTLLAQYGYTDNELTSLQAQLEKEVAAVVARYEPQLSQLSRRRELLISRLLDIVGDDERWVLMMIGHKGKTLPLRSGDISRRTTSKTKVTDLADLLKGLRARKLLRKFTTAQEPKPDLVKLKKNPGLVARLPGIELVERENMVLKPKKFGRKEDRDIPPTSRPIP